MCVLFYAEMMLPGTRSRLLCEHKNIITYNVSINNKNLNINQLGGYTPKSQGIKNHIHSLSEFFIFYFATCLLVYSLLNNQSECFVSVYINLSPKEIVIFSLRMFECRNGNSLV